VNGVGQQQMMSIAQGLREAVDDADALSQYLAQQADRLTTLAMGEQAVAWDAPVGVNRPEVYPDQERYEPADYYCAAIHDLTGRGNGGYQHPGVDINLAVWPYGDVDRGQPVFAVASGEVYRVSWSDSYLGSVIIATPWTRDGLEVRADWWDGRVRSRRWIIHPGDVLYWRYWHLANDRTFRGLNQGDTVETWQHLGALGDYTLGQGGDHLHLDCTLTPREAHWWFRHPEVRWVDPLRILSEVLGGDLVDLMVAK
jgi:murein DD-endopeptidase MepM/ murein hydrolase activator NlpD